jgi:release factor glutamine methyltransferase
MNFKTNKIKDIREYYLSELKKIYPYSEAVTFLDLIFERRFNVTKVERILEPGRRLSESEMLTVHADVKALKTFKPIQYILNATEFCGLKIFVDERVLIPRPETEELVSRIVDEQKDNEGLAILDIGTGSGAIALALKNALPGVEISGCDISPEAIAVARENGNETDLAVNFFLLDIFNSADWTDLPHYDLIVSNPPYVTDSEKQLMAANVLAWEPELALFVPDDDPMLFYRQVIRFADQHLKPGGNVYFEINENFGAEMHELLQNNDYQNIDLQQDLSGKDRMISAEKTRQ